MVLFQNSAPRGFGVGAGIWRMSYGSKKADGIILTGCTISQIERKAEKSATGQSRRFEPLPVTSGLPRTTDIGRPARLVRFVPILLKNSVLKPTVIADSFRRVGAGDRIDDGSAAG